MNSSPIRDYGITHWISEFTPIAFAMNGEVLGATQGAPAVFDKDRIRLLPADGFSNAVPRWIDPEGTILGDGEVRKGDRRILIWRGNEIEEAGSGYGVGIDDRGRMICNLNAAPEAYRLGIRSLDGTLWQEEIESFVHEMDRDGTLYGEVENRPCYWSVEGSRTVLPFPDGDWRQGHAIGRDGQGRILGNISLYEEDLADLEAVGLHAGEAMVRWTDGVPEIVERYSHVFGGFVCTQGDRAIANDEDVSPWFYDSTGFHSIASLSTRRFQGRSVDFEKCRAVDLDAAGRVLLAYGNDAVVIAPLPT